MKCYRTCRGHAQALHVLYMLLRREDYLNVMVHVCDSFLKDKRWGPIEPYLGTFLVGTEALLAGSRPFWIGPCRALRPWWTLLCWTLLDPFRKGQKSCVVVPHPDEFEFYNRSPRPCPGVKCYRTCRGHAQAVRIEQSLGYGGCGRDLGLGGGGRVDEPLVYSVST